MRLFVAFDLPPAVTRRIAAFATAQKDLLPAARWVPPENVHLTLAFLGEVEQSRLPSLVAALGSAFAAHPPVRLAVVGGGCFPPRRPARVAWLGIEAEPPLGPLHAAVARGVESALGLPPEKRPFHPHLTLARPRKPWPRGAVDAFTNAAASWVRGVETEELTFNARQGRLIRSHLGPSGARYEVLESFPLNAAEG